MERLFVFADFNWLGKAELVGSCAMKNCAALTVMHLSLMRIGLRFMPELSFRKTSTITQACNIPSQEVIFSDVFLMLCQIGGDVPCSKEENRYRPLKKKEQSDLFPHSITSWASMTPPEWVDLGLRRKWKVIISMCLHLSRYPH